MDIVVGIAFGGGLLWLVLAWLGRSTGSAPASPPRQRTMPGGAVEPPSPGRHPTAAGPAVREEIRLRESDALVDGLVIGHYLTRDHYQRQIDELEGSVEALEHDRSHWLDDGIAGAGDDFDQGLDYAEFDAMGGFGVEPWADDLFDMDDED